MLVKPTELEFYAHCTTKQATDNHEQQLGGSAEMSFKKNNCKSHVKQRTYVRTTKSHYRDYLQRSTKLNLKMDVDRQSIF